MLITDPGISTNASEEYLPYSTGLEKDVFIKDVRDNRPLKTIVWPGECVMPDFVTHPDVGDWWAANLHRFHTEVQFDGIWLDVREGPSIFSPLWEVFEGYFR